MENVEDIDFHCRTLFDDVVHFQHKETKIYDKAYFGLDDKVDNIVKNIEKNKVEAFKEEEAL